MDRMWQTQITGVFAMGFEIDFGSYQAVSHTRFSDLLRHTKIAMIRENPQGLAKAVIDHSRRKRRHFPEGPAITGSDCRCAFERLAPAGGRTRLDLQGEPQQFVGLFVEWTGLVKIGANG